MRTIQIQVISLVEGTSKGAMGGEKVHTLTTEEMPTHNHGSGGSNFVLANGTSSTDYGSTNRGLDEVSRQYVDKTANAGNSDAHENRPPYYALAFIMRVK